MWVPTSGGEGSISGTISSVTHLIACASGCSRACVFNIIHTIKQIYHRRSRSKTEIRKGSKLLVSSQMFKCSPSKSGAGQMFKCSNARSNRWPHSNVSNVQKSRQIWQFKLQTFGLYPLHIIQYWRPNTLWHTWYLTSAPDIFYSLTFGPRPWEFLHSLTSGLGPSAKFVRNKKNNPASL